MTYNSFVGIVSHWHLTPASSLWLQPAFETYEQSNKLDSVPIHPTLSRYISPIPAPKWALEKATASVRKKQCFYHSGLDTLLSSEYPNCLQATVASGVPQ